MIRRLVLTAAVLAIAGAVQPADGQDGPPRPLDQLASQFTLEPNNPELLGMIAGCIEEGTWNRELLARVLGVAQERSLTWSLASWLGWSVMNCDMEFVDEWFRTILDQTTDRSIAMLAARALSKSSARREVNQAAARRAVFDTRRSEETRTAIAASIAKDGGVKDGISMLAQGYRENGTSAPAGFLATVIALRSEEAISAKRDLLNAVLQRPEGPGAIPLINALMSDALTYDSGDPWFTEFRAVVESIAQGSIGSSSEIRQFVTPRVGRFQGGG